MYQHGGGRGQQRMPPNNGYGMPPNNGYGNPGGMPANGMPQYGGMGGPNAVPFQPNMPYQQPGMQPGMMPNYGGGGMAQYGGMGGPNAVPFQPGYGGQQQFGGPQQQYGMPDYNQHFGQPQQFAHQGGGYDAGPAPPPPVRTRRARHGQPTLRPPRALLDGPSFARGVRRRTTSKRGWSSR
jgi:hypothetical protein